MITNIDKKTAERLMAGARDIFTLKIYSNMKAYDGYDFFSVYGGNGILIGRYYDDFVVRAEDVVSEDTIEELSLFLRVCGFKSALMDANTAKKMGFDGLPDTEESIIYKFSSELVPKDEELPKMEEIETEPVFDDVFSILNDGFPGIRYEDWYIDISHKTRHGISVVYMYEGAVATAMADINKSVFISLVATKNELKGQGKAKKLLRRLGLYYENQGKEVSILCKPELSSFYIKTGFYEVGRAITVKSEKLEKL